MPRPDSLAVSVLLTFAVAMGPMSTDLYLPSLPALTRYFATDVATVQLTLSVFLVGFAVAQLVYGPLSDRFGRRPMMIAGTGLFVVATAGCVAATSIEMLIAARFVQALGACAGPVLGRAVVRDVYGREGAARMLAYIGAAMALAPAVGPMIGGYLTVWFGWRANFVLIAVYGLVTLAGLAALLAETNPHLGEVRSLAQMLRNYVSFLRSRTYVGYVLCNSATFSGLFAFISGSAFVFIDVLGLPPNQYGFCFATAVGGYIAGTMFAGRMTLRLGIDRMVRLGAAACAVGGVLMAGPVLAGYEAVWSVLAPMVLYAAGVGMVMPNSMAGALGPFATAAGAASALLGFIQMGIAAAVGIAVGAAFDGTARPMALTIAVMGIGAWVAYGLLIGWRDDAAKGPTAG